MKVAIYARYSSDNQRDASIADQFRMCRLHAEKQGWHIVEEYSDHAISGASLIRPGIQALMADAMGGRFDLILAEAMDRLSRDQEDIAGIFKRMSYADVKMFTLSEGEVTHLHVGLKGTMNALFLKDLADKTRRGQRGRVEAGKSGGGNAYGYDVVKKLDANGEPIRGDRTINEFQAEVVRRSNLSRQAVSLITRRLLAEGDVGGAAEILGRPHRVVGEVGAQARGRRHRIAALEPDGQVGDGPVADVVDASADGDHRPAGRGHDVRGHRIDDDAGEAAR